MKNYILFLFFAFQFSTYAQDSKSQNIYFEEKIKLLEIDNCNPNKKLQLINESCPDINLTILCDSDDLSLKQTDITINQLKNLDLSKGIKKDYLVFNFNISTVADADND